MNSRAESAGQMNPRQIKVLLFGASGMLGAAVMRECLADPQVARVMTVGRSASALHSTKLEEIVHADLSDYSAIETSLTDLDACFFCLGVSSAGLSEAEYSRVTYDYTLAAANILVRLNPRLTFIYVSGSGTDSSGAGRIMWARVKGRTENSLLALPFAATQIGTAMLNLAKYGYVKRVLEARDIRIVSKV
jgi:uncharacterized protein YbjT (DUF2867 family)